MEIPVELNRPAREAGASIRRVMEARTGRMRRTALTVVALVASSLVSWTATAAVTPEQMRNYQYPESLVASPKGPQVAWVVDNQGRRNVWVATAPEFKARQLTSYSVDDGQELTSLQVSNDGANVVYVRGGEHGANWDGGSPANPWSDPKGTKVQVWSVAFAGGAPRLLGEGDYPAVSPDNRHVAFIKDKIAMIAPIDGSSPAQRLFAIRGDTSSLTWSPDGSRLAFVSGRGSHALIGVFTDENSPITWIAPAPATDASPRWSPDGKRIAFMRMPGQGGTPPPALQRDTLPWAIWVADANTGEGKQVWASGKTPKDSAFYATLDWAAGDRLLFRSYQDGWQHLYSVPASGGQPLLLTAGDYLVEEFTLTPDRKHVIYNANTGKDPDDIDRRHLYKVPVDQASPRPLTAGTGLEWTPTVTGDNHLVFFSATAQRPPLPATVSLKGGEIRLLAPDMLSADYPVKELVIPKRVSFRAPDGVLVHGQLFEPKSKASGKRPAVLYMHGGPPRQMLLGWHYMGYYSNDYMVNQYLASQGYVVLAVNYRLGIGYGHAFQDPEHAGPRGASEYQDIKAAGQYLQALPQVDPKRVGLYGGSYGGYLTAMGLARDSDLFAVGVDIHGVHDWVDDYGLDTLLQRKHYQMPVDAQQALDVAWQSSPVSSIDKWKSPVLFIHGDDDRNVYFSQTVDLVRRLENTNVHYETLVLVDETHSIQRYANALKMNRAAIEFLGRYLKP